MTQDGFLLTEGQLRALEKAKEEQKAQGKVQREHPGYLGAQDTFAPHRGSPPPLQGGFPVSATC